MSVNVVTSCLFVTTEDSEVMILKESKEHL